MRKKVFSLCMAVLLWACVWGVPARAAESALPITLSCEAALLMDADTGTIILEKNAHQGLPIASVTKIMTLLLCMEALDRGDIALGDVLVASESAAGMGGSQVLIETGGTYSVADLMKSIIVASGNDASVLMAEALCGSEELFVTRMNERAAELGMLETQFINCTGLSAPGHICSAYDVALMSRELIQYPLFFQYSSIWMDEISHPNNRITMISNTNKLIRQYGGCDGIKTGSTKDAGFCVSATARKGDTRFIAVILGGDSSKVRFDEAEKLLNYGFANYQTTVVLEQGEVVAKSIPVRGGIESPVNGVSARKLTLFSEKGSQEDPEYIVTLYDDVAAPLSQGDVIGEITILLGEEAVDRCDLLCDRAVQRGGFWYYFSRIMNDWQRN